MPKTRAELEAAAGRLISAVQKEWNAEAGEASASESESVMHTCHELLKSAKAQSLRTLLGGRTVAQFLGEAWVNRHPQVVPALREFQALIEDAHAV